MIHDASNCEHENSHLGPWILVTSQLRLCCGAVSRTHRKNEAQVLPVSLDLKDETHSHCTHSAEYGEGRLGSYRCDASC